jgi:hypothetical protein
MIPISIDKFVDLYMKNNQNENKQEIINSLREALASKDAGANCSQCGEQIWAVGTGITGWKACFTCTTGETDDSEDYEVVM